MAPNEETTLTVGKGVSEPCTLDRNADEQGVGRVESEMTSQWLIRNKVGGFERTGELALYWEVAGDPISDDFTPDEISALELFAKWRQRYPDAVQPITWFLQGAQTHEFAPFQGEEDWLTHYYWPLNTETGEEANFLKLPVVDKLWRGGRANKGGFIQEALGWKPSPFQDSADFSVLARAAGLSGF